MKKEIILTILIIAIITSSCTSNLSPPKIQLSTSSFDLGNIYPDEGLRKEEFFIKNLGSMPLTILSVSTSCGCTEAEVESNEVLPGKETKLAVTYDPSVHPGLIGKIKRVVYVKSNDPSNPEVELELTGNSLPSKNQSKMAERHEDELEDFEISPFDVYDKIKNKEPIKILDVREDFEFLDAHIKDSLILSVNNITQLNLAQLGLKKNDEVIVYCRSGKRSAEAYEILTSLGYNNVKSMQGGITHWTEESFPVEKGLGGKEPKVKRDASSIKFNRMEHDFGRIPQYGGIVNITFIISNTGKNDLVIGSIATSCGCTTAKIDDSIIPPGKSTLLTVFFDPNLHKEPEGRFSRTVFIESNDLNKPESEIKIYVDILEGE